MQTILNEKRLGFRQKAALDFVRKFGGWKSFTKDSFTADIIKSLKKRGLIEIHPEFTDMFTAVPKWQVTHNGKLQFTGTNSECFKWLLDQ